MNQFLPQIYKRVNVPFVKNLLIFIVLAVEVIMSGYVLTIGENVMSTTINS
jgi:hypothetical protein